MTDVYPWGWMGRLRPAQANYAGQETDSEVTINCWQG